MKFAVSHTRDSTFKSDGLRDFFEYRDLGIRAATGGKVDAHAIRARHGEAVTGGTHHHEVEFQLVYVLRGWIRFEYDGVGEVLLEPGSCVHQPPGIHHREIAHSDDLELIEVVMPADFKTVSDD